MAGPTIGFIAGKDFYLLRSKMSMLDYLPHSCATADANAMASEEAAKIIGGRDVVESSSPAESGYDGWEFEVEKMESPLSKVTVPMLKVTYTVGEREMGAAFEARIASVANQLTGNYNMSEHRACAT
jgi:hypothetical protein